MTRDSSSGRAMMMTSNLQLTELATGSRPASRDVVDSNQINGQLKEPARPLRWLALLVATQSCSRWGKSKGRKDKELSLALLVDWHNSTRTQALRG